MRFIISSVGPGSARGFRLVGRAWKTSKLRYPGGILTIEPLQLAPFHAKKQSLCSDLKFENEYNLMLCQANLNLFWQVFDKEECQMQKDNICPPNQFSLFLFKLCKCFSDCRSLEAVFYLHNKILISDTKSRSVYFPLRHGKVTWLFECGAFRVMTFFALRDLHEPFSMTSSSLVMPHTKL